MSAATLPTERRTLRLRLVALVRAPSDVPRTRRRSPRAVLLWFLAFAGLLHLLALALLDAKWRDPEYSLRVPHLRDRQREHPGRPVAVVVGSSRVAMGVKPSAWEAARPGHASDPLLFNFGTVGAGPVQQLITVKHLFADGFRPDVVVLEYWPPVLRQDGRFSERHRVGLRLRLDDRDVVRRYFPEPDRIEREMWGARLNPLGANRERWLACALPKWLPANRHADAPWRDLDGWGWLPGPDVAPDDEATRQKFYAHHRPKYADQFDGHTIHPDSTRAFREAVEVIHGHGARAVLLFLPEAPEFQSWYPPDVNRVGRGHFAQLARELGVPAVDARDWFADDQFADGLHLSRTGAARFTERLGAAVR